jgi:TolB-like protein
VIQVADVAFPSWGIPESAIRFLFYAALLCFPIALVFGWYFDIRSDGIYRTRKAGPNEIFETRMRWQDYLILAGLAGIAVSIVLGSAEQIRFETEMTPTAKELFVERRQNSVAVLPFDNLDPNPETGYFSDGVTDEILGELANIRGLFVPNRRSSFVFRNTNESAASITAKLGVLYLLDGTIRRDGDLVRVTARLIDKDGAQVWSESFDRKLEKIFAIQSEIANAVASRVASEIVRPAERPAARQTENANAYNDYLLGKQLFRDRSPHWFKKAEALFHSAINLDPDFAPPYAYLGLILAFISFDTDFTDKAFEFTQAALSLEPDLADAYLALGLIHGRRQQTDLSMEAYRRAIELDPTLTDAYNLLANTLGRQGRFRDAHELRLQAFEHDPLNPVLINNIASQLAYYGDLDQAERLILRMTQLPATPDFMYWRLKDFYTQLGKLDRVIHWSKTGIRRLVDEYDERLYPRVVDELGNLSFVYFNLRLHGPAEFWATLAAQQHPDMHMGVFWQLDVCEYREDLTCIADHIQELEAALRSGAVEPTPEVVLRIGGLYLLLGNVDKAIEHLGSLFDVEDLDELNWNRLIDPAHLAAFIYLNIGQDTDAEQLLSATNQFLESAVVSEGLRDAKTYSQLALNRWLRDDKEGAIDSLRRAIVAGWILLETCRRQPEWQKFLALPELQEDLLKVQKEIARQREVVEAADAKDDFREIVEGFLAEREPGT